MIFKNNILLALDFRTFLENMNMSSSLSKILETGINVFKSNYRIIKKFVDFIILFRGYSKSSENQILSIYNLPCGYVSCLKNSGPDRFSRFDVYWLQTETQTSKVNIRRWCTKVFILNHVITLTPCSACAVSLIYSLVFQH